MTLRLEWSILPWSHPYESAGEIILLAVLEVEREE